MAAKPESVIVETRDPAAALRWNALLELQVAAYLPYEISHLLGSQVWAKAARVLDAGCGNGYFLSRLRQFFPEKDYTGLDISSELVEAARDNSGLHGVRIVHQDFFEFESDPYDVVIMRLIVQHMAGLDRILERLNRLVTKGGTVFIVEPDPSVFLNYPRTPLFEKLLQDYVERTNSAGLNRGRLANLFSNIEEEGCWRLRGDTTVVAPSIGPFENSSLAQIFSLWIDLFERVPGLNVSFASVRKEIDCWSSQNFAFNQIGIRFIELERR